jgi:hypothetical protein
MSREGNMTASAKKPIQIDVAETCYGHVFIAGSLTTKGRVSVCELRPSKFSPDGWVPYLTMTDGKSYLAEDVSPR